MLIDCSYFTKGPRHVVNTALGTMPNQYAVEVKNAIEGYIAGHQQMYLVKMLGHRLGNKINAYLVCVEEEDWPPIYDPYELVCKHLRESFADYVFYQILRASNTQATMTGVIRIKNANEYVSPMQRQISAWNSMVEKNRLFAEWCTTSHCPFPNIAISEDMLTKINTFNL